MDYDSFLTTQQLIQQVGEWATHNFEDHWPALGLAEEVGEACHCILKHHQKIRGFDNEDKFKQELSDALSDATIYLCHYAYLNKSFFSFDSEDVHHKEKDFDKKIVAHVFVGVVSILTYDASNPEPNPIVVSGLCQRMFMSLDVWANCYDIDLEKTVNETWFKIVSKRDWHKNKHHG